MIGLKISVPSVSLTYDKKHTKQVLRSAAQEVANVARQLIRSSSGKSKGKHQVSLPGNAPSSLTGKLASSIRVKVKDKKTAIVAQIKDVEFYAKFLEAGAHGGGGKKGNRNKRGGASTIRQLLPRPFLSTALESRQNSIATRIREAIDKDIKFEKIK